MTKNLMHEGGIYQITNIIDGSFYIGSTIEFARRKTKHFSELKRGTHDNTHLQRIYNKHGVSSLIFSILAVYPTTSRPFLYEVEQKVIDHLVPVLNKTSIVAQPTAPEKPVAKFNLSGKFVGAYRSIKEAAHSSGVHANSIQDVIANRYFTSANHFWTLIDENGVYDQLPEIFMSRWKSSSSYKRLLNNKIYQWSLEGTLLKVWDNPTYVSKELGIDRRYLRKHLSNPTRVLTCCGFKFTEAV